MLSILTTGPSNSAKALAGELGVKRVRPERLNTLRPRTLINWGNAGVNPGRHRILNRNVDSNKINAFRKLEAAGIVANIPDFTTDINRAKEWAKKDIILARSTATGSGGVGITVVRPGENVPANQAFYVKYIKKQAEYRIHVVAGRAIFTQQKRKKNGVQQDENQALIRNHDNGWVFAENDVTFPTEAIKRLAEQLAINSVRACGLDFGAVDLIVGKDNNVYFLEVNTRPGIESTRLLQAYGNAFKALDNQRG